MNSTELGCMLDSREVIKIFSKMDLKKETILVPTDLYKVVKEKFVQVGLSKNKTRANLSKEDSVVFLTKVKDLELSDDNDTCNLPKTTHMYKDGEIVLLVFVKEKEVYKLSDIKTLRNKKGEIQYADWIDVPVKKDDTEVVKESVEKKLSNEINKNLKEGIKINKKLPKLEGNTRFYPHEYKEISNPLRKKYSDLLVDLLNENKMTYVALQREIGVSDATISSFIDGKNVQCHAEICDWILRKCLEKSGLEKILK